MSVNTNQTSSSSGTGNQNMPQSPHLGELLHSQNEANTGANPEPESHSPENGSVASEEESEDDRFVRLQLDILRTRFIQFQEGRDFVVAEAVFQIVAARIQEEANRRIGQLNPPPREVWVEEIPNGLLNSEPRLPVYRETDPFLPDYAPNDVLPDYGIDDIIRGEVLFGPEDIGLDHDEFEDDETEDDGWEEDNEEDIYDAEPAPRDNEWRNPGILLSHLTEFMTDQERARWETEENDREWLETFVGILLDRRHEVRVRERDQQQRV